MKIRPYRLILIVALIFNSSFLFAQQHTVSGVVKDSETSMSIPGATIIEQGTTIGTTTDIDGNFSITVTSPNATLEVSFIGYKTLRIPINGQTSIDVSLGFQVTELDEIVVIGYGTQKKRVVTGAIASVSSDEISSTPVLRVEQAMQGRTAGDRKSVV